MKRLSQIHILKKLVLESMGQPKIIFEGGIDSEIGCTLQLVGLDDKLIGYMKIIDFKKSFPVDSDIPKFYENKLCQEMCDENFFTDNNSVYLHSLWVDPNHRGKRYGNLLMNSSEEISKKSGYNFATSIVDKENEISQNMNKKLGYRIHKSDGLKDFLYKKL